MKTWNNFILSLILTILLVPITHCQISPGGVGTANLTGWFRADDLVSGNVTSWTTNYPTGPSAVTVTDGQSPYPQLEQTPSGSVSNYNNTIHFFNNTFVGQNISTVQGLFNATPPNLLTNATATGQGSFFSAFYQPVPQSGNGHMLLYNKSTDAIQLRNLNANGRIAIGKLPTNSTFASRDWVEDNQPNITSYKGNRSGSTTMKGYNKGALLGASIASQSSGVDGLSFGYHPTIGTSAFNGYLHEFIFFNVDLTDIQMAQVHTYLAIKYGVTLNNQAGGTDGDYIATSGTLIWDADQDPTYHNDVIGIGRDDIEGLYQRQSHIFDDSVRLYVGPLASMNAANLTNINTDISYLLMGHNNGRLCGTNASNSESPSGISSRLEREFRLTKTNFDQPFNLDIVIDTCSSIDGLISLSNIRLLIDEDGDFTNAQSLSVADGITFSVQNGTVSVTGISNIHFPNNTTRYITIGYSDLELAILPSGPVCANETGYIVFDITNASGPVTINYTENGVSQTITNVVDGDTLFLSQNNNTAYIFEPFGSLFNCCAASGSLSYTQTIYPLPTVTITATEQSVCIGQSTVLTASGGTITWSDNLLNGQPYFPQETATYWAYGTSTDGCIDSTSITIDVYPLPVLTLNNPPAEICEGESVTLEASGANTYDWTPNITNGQPFEPTVGSVYYEVTGTDVNGCQSTTGWTINVIEQPIADAVADPTSGVAPLPVTFVNYSTNATNYLWDFGNGEQTTQDDFVSTTYATGGTFTVTLTASNGICEDTWTTLIVVDPGEIFVELPNVFTPNNDNSNDTYTIHSQNISEIEGSILNRWGDIVFTFNSPDFEWTGENASDGVYTIVFKAIGKNGETLTGHGFIHLYH